MAINKDVNLPASGAFTPPPAHARQEVTLPGSERATAEQIAQARRNEQPMPSFTPKPQTDEQMAAFLGKTVGEIRAMRDALTARSAPAPTTRPSPVTTPAEGIILTDAVAVPAGKVTISTLQPLPERTSTGLRRAVRSGGPLVIPPTSTPSVSPASGSVSGPEPADVPPVLGAPEPAAAPIDLPGPITREPYRPAQSDTDSPSRGMPTAVADPGKRVTGGFGDVGDAQYFPLTGLEVRAIVESQLTELLARIKDDLRFSIAQVYPRVNVRCAIEVECFVQDSTFSIVKKLIPAHTKTPLDVARQHAQECCYVMEEAHVEMTDDGESVTPPNAARLAHGLSVPAKHAVEMPNRQRMLVDLDEASLTRSR